MKELTITSDAPGEKLFLLGNEAIARGAIEGGVQVAAAYPGTPSSEIMATLAAVAKELNIYVEWSTNEKVAFEVALAASYCGVRAMASMKHVGVNVAHEPLMQASYIGAVGGLVLVDAEDPSAWSSQNEQDNRWIAEQAFLPVLEPSSVQEAKDMMANAFDLSEKFAHPFILRTVMRINHARSDVVLDKISRERRKGFFKKDPSRLVYVPVQVARNKPLMLQRLARIKDAVNTLPYNQLRLVKGTKRGIIACGISYSYVLEALKWLGLEEKISVLKISTPHPLPEELVKELLNSVEEVLVVEELDPYVELHAKVIAQENGITARIHGKDLVPKIGELSTVVVTQAIARLTNVEAPIDFAAIENLQKEVAPLLPPRPPAMCAGCPHRASLYAIKVASQRVAREQGKDVQPIYPGDITCATLGYSPPLENPDSCLCMGASFGIANGLSHVIEAPIVATLGDSTFFHAGIPPLINAVYNKANITMVVLDNGATAMTGFQPHPGTGYTATGEETTKVYPEEVARACGVKFIEVLDPLELEKAINTVERAIRFNGPAVVVFRRLCTILELREKRKSGEKIVPCYVESEKCIECWQCVDSLGCPAIITEDNKVIIDESLCAGCRLCAQICPAEAIV